jgi:hypothetical protein
MTIPPPPHAWVPCVARRISSSSGARVLDAHFAPCVLDLLGHARPQSHADRELVI